MAAEHVGASVELNNGVKMPWLGLGVWQGKPRDGDDVVAAIRHALTIGYQCIDTAAGYENEPGVGKAIRESGLNRENVFITTKLRNSDQGYETTLAAFEESRKKLGVDYIDLYLIHWPNLDKLKETWRAFEKLYKEGLVRAIGVSNFQIRHLEPLFQTANIIPAVNQVEYHPLLTQRTLHDFCMAHNIQLEAWSPLMKGNLSADTIAELAEKYGKTPAQIVLRWDLQNRVVTIPKSVRTARIEENADIFDFQLTDEDMAKVSALNQDYRFTQYPPNY
ncbi:aldo/keto reductase [Alicyclobacillus ferrooxydans]|uniref:Glyoxal reductase n=1 Tax=Alicyclobacillus ferrooxydans TaxID=471514 RepID=A0A0P9CWY0_9BACL|nr:aldo/keto reductase [Alicyclobacillus ferrooxydans]KPV44275.1 glyoxal reductase [Alicyclobacillus ferrooxydans]